MLETISDLFQMQDRFLRSAHLERDFGDPAALSGYVLTPQTKRYLARLSFGLHENSGQRAWRITGDFGTGKSSFALITAHLFGDKRAELPKRLREDIKATDLKLPPARLLPVLVTGSREPLAYALLFALHKSLQDTCKRGRIPAVVERIASALKSKSSPPSEGMTVSLLSEAATYVATANKGTGILIVLDELGKFLEFASMNPDQDDVFLLQRIAETASRSGKTPIFVLGLLHQGFNAYASQLSQPAQKEWEKVASRFEELIFDQPIEQTALMVAEALNLRKSPLTSLVTRVAREDMSKLLKLGWYGPGYTKDLIENAGRIYPLHSSVIPVLVKLFSRFGQNERSLFSFLISNEPFGLQEFSGRVMNGKEFFRIHHLYDYARAAFGHRLGTQSYRSHWNQISSLIDSFPAQTLELEILKTVGLLNMLDATNQVATEEIIRIAVQGGSEISIANFDSALSKLQKIDRVLYFRGLAGGYCLWPHTSVNLEKAYEDAFRSVGQNRQAVAPLLEKYLETRPIVARRHYIETGNLRHFEIVFSAVGLLSDHTKLNYEATDGRIIVALCETEEERLQALQFAENEGLRDNPAILLAIPKPLGILGNLLDELSRWEWISNNVSELNSDSFAAEEVTRRIAASRQLLEQRVHSFIGLKEFGAKTELRWFSQNKPVHISGGRELLSYLSDVSKNVYGSAPIVSNELINRRELSSAAAAARMRLMEGILSSASKPFLGIDPTKKPPEMSMYLSILKEGGIHQELAGTYGIAEPTHDNDPCNLLPVLCFLRTFLESQPDARVRLSEVLSAMRQPPYGVRDGLSPLLLSIFMAIHEQNVALYDNGAFMRQVNSLDLMRMAKVPENFEIQYCKLTGVRSELFDKLVEVLGIEAGTKNRTDLLDVVRPLCVFAAELPAYTQRTAKLSESALNVRKVLLGAKEPSRLLFQDLPKAFGYASFSKSERGDRGKIQHYAEALKAALSELKATYPDLQDRMKSALVDSFELEGSYDSFQQVRLFLARRAQPLVISITEPRSKAFCHRLMDVELQEAAWLESLGSFVCSMPPNKWTDADESKFHSELFALSAKFRRLESFDFSKNSARSGDTAIRIAITKTDGDERDQVIHVADKDEKRIAEIEQQISAILKGSHRIGLAATARAFWNAIKSEEANIDGTSKTHS